MKGLDAGHLVEVGSGFEGHGPAVVAADELSLSDLVLLGGRVVVTEIESLGFRRTERETVSELVGETREVSGRVCCRRQQMDGGRRIPVLWLGAAGRAADGSAGRPPMLRVVGCVQPSRARLGGPWIAVRWPSAV